MNELTKIDGTIEFAKGQESNPPGVPYHGMGVGAFPTWYRVKYNDGTITEWVRCADERRVYRNELPLAKSAQTCEQFLHSATMTPEERAKAYFTELWNWLWFDENATGTLGEKHAELEKKYGAEARTESAKLLLERYR